MTKNELLEAVTIQRTEDDNKNQTAKAHAFAAIFQVLDVATQLDQSGFHRIEAATKYYEGCYLMRQLLAGGNNGVGNNGSSSIQLSRTCRRLLADKIQHYTTRAQTLYFDETSRAAADGDIETSTEKRVPPMSVLITALDDVVSVLTTLSHPLQPTTTMAAAEEEEERVTQDEEDFDEDYDNGAPPTPIGRPADTTTLQQRKSRPPLMALPVATMIRRGGGRGNRPRTTNTASTITTGRRSSEQQQQQQQQRHEVRRRVQKQHPKHTTPPITKSRAELASERKLQIQMILANSKLGQAIDLDEYYHRYRTKITHNVLWTGNNSNKTCSERIVQLYVEASEDYLHLIQCATRHQQKYYGQPHHRRHRHHTPHNTACLKIALSSKVDPWRKQQQQQQSTSQVSSASTVTSQVTTVIPKLKHLLSSALDRIETLKLLTRRTGNGDGGGR